MSQRSSLSSFCRVVMVAVCAALPAQADAPLGQFTVSMVMVTDNKTGLTWQKSEGPKLTWSNAKDYCAGLVLNTMTDWRLPTVKELVTLADPGLTDPSIDTSVNGFPGTAGSDPPGSYFWSATPFASSSPPAAWTVSLFEGGTNVGNVVNAWRVRCVR